MFSFFIKKSATPAYIPSTVHAEIAAEDAADAACMADLLTMAATHTDCSDKCHTYVSAEISRRRAWGWV